MVGEFDLISRYFAPLAGPEGLGLLDDAAVITPPAGQQLVMTADALISGVHFLETDPPNLVARKALRVNLSDLAAMGARAHGYLLTIAWPGPPDETWVAAFAAGLAEDQANFGIGLLGGDTTAGPGPLTLSVTAIGFVAQGKALTRNRARAGDHLYVSGSLGDGALGLLALGGEFGDLDAKARDHLINRYRLPRPRLALGKALSARGLATAAIDVSDGLAADLGHLASTSGLAAQIETAALPLSDSAHRAIGLNPDLRRVILSGGDDYELLFAAAPASREAVVALASELDLPLTPIGRLCAGSGLVLIDAEGREELLEASGWQHF